MQWKSTALVGALMVAAAGVAGPILHGQTIRPAQVLRGFQLPPPAQIGVTAHDPSVDEAKQAAPGVVVDEVQENSPAEKAGIKSGDRIVDFDGDRVRSVRQFSRMVQETAPDRTVPVVLSRGDQQITVNVAPEPANEFRFRLLQTPDVWATPMPAPAPLLRPTPAPPAPRAAPVPPVAPFGFNVFRRPPRLGATIESLNDQLAAYFGVKDGVLVNSVAEGSTAAKAGLKAGDVITAVNGDHVGEPVDVTRALGRLDSGAALTIDVVRDRKHQTLKGTLDRDSELRYRARM